MIDRVIEWIWVNRKHLTLLTSLIIILGVFQLKNFTIYFDSERILEDLTNDTTFINSSAGLNDELVFMAVVKSNTPLTYDNALLYQEKLDSLQRTQDVKRLFHLFNEKYIPSTSLIPVPKNKLSLSSEANFQKTLDPTSRFASDDLTDFLIVVETDSISLNRTNQLMSEMEQLFRSADNEIIFAGKAPSETYFQTHVTYEFILLACLSSILCLGMLYLFTSNWTVVATCLVCVVLTILSSLSLSISLFGGVELFMIISPAIFFIVTISDIMHFISKQPSDALTKKEQFKMQMKRVGVPVLLTSLTTTFSFFSFYFIDIQPLKNFGLITGLGVLIALWISMLCYALLIDRNVRIIHPNLIASNFLNRVTLLLSNYKQRIIWIVLLLVCISVSVAPSLKIDNYLLDELNESSEFYQSSHFIDQQFGGLKPLLIGIDSDAQEVKADALQAIQEKMQIDFHNATTNDKKIFDLVFKTKSRNGSFLTRMQDIGSFQSKQIYNSLDDNLDKTEVQFGGIGYLFDTTSDDLTRQLLFGLLVAILTVGSILFLSFGFQLKHFLLGILTNVLPLFITIGIVLATGSFYLCLSNAFIFTVAFGLIIDDSIHIISAFEWNKRTYNGQINIREIQNSTGKTVIKTTLIVLCCLLPLLLSEFKSVSQLAVLTILSSIIAIILDVGLLPHLLSTNK